ncbi:MAG: hypothetical protein IKY20_02035 [Alistipes sp.]|nr:hypothetical protein [Alistipes sp.]
MRKIYSTLKSVVAATLVAAMTFAASCSYDDTGVINQIEEIKVDLEALAQRVTALENKLQTEVENLQALIDGQVVIVDVETDAEGNQTIKLSDGSTITVLAPVECTCEPATPCQCDPLEYRVNADGVLEVSPDGINWVAITGVTPECVVANVVVEDGIATITLADGTSFKTAVAELVEFEAAKSAIYVKAAETISVPFAINDAVEDINVMNQPLGWKAAIEVPTRAVGGMDYVLNVTGPAKDFLQYAEKSGKVSIHFNTAAGACKVMTVDVELAAIDLQVDKAGNITITNTMVDRYERENWGQVEYIEEFNNFYFAVVGLDDYEDCGGDLESVYNANWGEFNIPAAASYIQNFFANVGENDYNNAIFVDGENEKWTVNFTVEEVIDYLDWYGQMTYEGNSFVVCVIPTDVNNYGSLVWDDMIAVPFKQLSISLVENVDNRVFNSAYFDVTLRGAESYHIYPVSKAEVDMYINEYQYYTSVEEYYWAMLESFLAQPNWYSFGFKIESDVVEDNIALADLLAYTSEFYHYETAPATEYYMCIFALEEGRTDYTMEDLHIYEFATADLVEAESPIEATIALSEDTNLYAINVDVTVSEDVNTVYYGWFEEELPAEDLKAELIRMAYSRTEDDFAESGYTFPLGTSVDAPKSRRYLGLLVIDAQGNYTLYNEELYSKEVVMNDAEFSIESVEFTTEAVTVTLAGLEDLEVKAYKYYIISVNGDSYYQKTEEECQDIAYNSNDYKYRSTEEHPIVITYTSDYKYSFAPDTYKLAVGVEFADGTYSKCVYGEYEFAAEGGNEETETPYFTTASRSGSWNDMNLKFTGEDTDLSVVLNPYGLTSQDTKCFTPGTYSVGVSYGYIYAAGYSYVMNEVTGEKIGNMTSGSVTISEVDGKYRFDIDVILNDSEPFKAVFEGLIDGMILPSEYVAPVQIEFTPVRAEYDLMFDLYEYNGGDAEYAFWLYDENNNYLEVICKFGPHTGWDYVYSAKYVGTDGELEFATVQTQAPNSYNCSSDAEKYFSVKASMVDNSYIMFYDVLPAVAVNYLGEGSTYAPGSDNQGGETPEQPDQPEVPGEVVELPVIAHAFGYEGSMETEVIFMESAERQHIIDFRMTGIQAGTYTDADNSIILGYSKYMYGNSEYGGGVIMSSANATITDNGDTTFTFDVTFVAEGTTYHIDYTTPVQEQPTGGEVVLTVNGGTGAADSYTTYIHLSDAEGKNSVKFVSENHHFNPETNFPYQNEYFTFQSSVSYVNGGSHFSFVNKSLVVDGVAYANSEVSNASASCTGTSITINFTVAGADYVFKYSM